MANKAQLVGSRQVLDWFTSEGLPYYAIMDKNVIFSSNKSNDDVDDVAEKLKRDLIAFEQNKNSDVLTFKVFEKPYRDAKKDEGTACRYIRLFDEYVGYVGAVENKNQVQLAMLETLERINSRLDALENNIDDDDDIEDDEPQQSGFVGLIDQALKSEEMQKMLITGLMGLANKFMQPKTMAVAGIPEEQDIKISQAIEILKKHDNNLGDDLLKLADIADKDINQFNFLLSMLRK